MKVTLLVLTLNEVDGMRSVMPRVKSDWVDQILVSDGGSTDGTLELAREAGYDVVEQQRKGIRFGYTEAWPHITGDIVITFSPDGNSVPEAIPPLIETMREGFDMVIASRYKEDAHSEDDTLLTGFGNWLFTQTINTLHGGRYTDAMVIYRAYRKSLFEELELHMDSGYRTPEFLFRTVLGVEPLLSVRAAKRRLRIAEIPADEPLRIGGTAKLQMIRWGLGYYYQVWREAFVWK